MTLHGCLVLRTVRINPMVYTEAHPVGKDHYRPLGGATVTQVNPWITSAQATSVRERRDVTAPSWRDWLPEARGASGADQSEVSEELPDVRTPTGPETPQPHVSAPSDALPIRRVDSSAALWVVGAHGGAGESTVAELHESWRAAEHAWPETADGTSSACVLVARTHVRGLLAARTALTQWAASGAGSVQLLGLVLVVDAPGKLPAPIRDLAAVISGGAPRVWEVPWIESWRLGDPVTERVPRSVVKLVSALRSLAASTTANADPSHTEEKS